MIWREGDPPIGIEITPNSWVEIIGKPYYHHEGIRSVKLEPYSLARASDIVALIKRNKQHFEQFENPAFYWTDESNTNQKINKKIKDPKNTNRFRMVILDNESLVGGINLSIRDTATLLAEIGYFVDQDHTRMGYASHAALLLMQFALTNLNIEKYLLEIHKRNRASIALARKLGFIAVSDSDDFGYIPFEKSLTE